MPTETAPPTTTDLLNTPTSPSGSSSSSRSSSSSSSSSSSADSALEVRQRAFDLLNRMGPESDDDVTSWPKQPEIRISSYQHGGGGGGGGHDGINNNNDHNRRRREEAAYHVENDDYNNDNSYMTLGGHAAQRFVQCVSDACKLGAAGIVEQNTAFAKSGYETIKSYAITETQDRFVVPSSIERQRGEFENVRVVDYHRSGRYT